MFKLLADIQRATLAARARTGDNSISTRVDKGRVQIVRVSFDVSGTSTIAPVSDWLPIADVPALLSKI